MISKEMVGSVIDLSERNDELMELTNRWMAQGMLPSDVVGVLVAVTNLVIDRNNLEYAYLDPEKR